MKTKTFTVMASLILAVSSFPPLEGAGLHSEERSPFYISLGIGVNHRKDAQDEPARLSFDPGYVACAAVGARLERLENAFLRNLRFEFEYTYQTNDADEIELRLGRNGPLSNNPEPAQGRISLESMQVLLCYDFPLRQLPSVENKTFLNRLIPFLGLGLGMTEVHVDGLGSPTLDSLAALYLGRDHFDMEADSDYALCYSARTGLAYEINPHWEVYLAWVYLKTNSMAIKDPFGDTNHPKAETWSALTGARFSF